MVFEVTDVWPDAAIHTNVIKNKFLINLAKKIERICYKCSFRIICLSKGIQSNIIGKGVAADKTLLVPNGVDLSLFMEFDSHKK